MALAGICEVKGSFRVSILNINAIWGYGLIWKASRSREDLDSNSDTSTMYDAINEEIFEVCMTCKHLIKQGWDFVEVKCGERRLGIGPSLIVKKGEEVVTIYCADDLNRLVRRDYE